MHWYGTGFGCLYFRVAVLTCVTIAGGGIQAAGTLSLFTMGEKIIIAGLFAQIFFFGFFMVVALTFHVRFIRHTSRDARSRSSVWAEQLYAIYAGSLLIMIRSLFRVVEYIMGNNGFLLRHEYFLYIFDAALMFVVMIVFLVIHPYKLTSPDVFR